MNSVYNKAPRFITVEGVEGVGKSTNIATIQKFLESHDIRYVLTREPGGTSLGEEIRNLLLREWDESVDPMTELLLMFAARSQHLSEVIKPALDNQAWVICDRFTDATYAYQGGGRGIDVGQIAILENLVQKQLRPDLTLILDLEPRLGLSRAAGRGELDRFERQELAFFERVRDVYLQRAALEPGRCKVINANQSLEQVQQAVLSIMERFCG